jgi:hypothetical protein
MQLTEIIRHHRARKFRRASWPEGVSWQLLPGVGDLEDQGFYTTALRNATLANVTPADVMAEDWEYTYG